MTRELLCKCVYSTQDQGQGGAAMGLLLWQMLAASAMHSACM
jgi:hypothetical protein